jgi:hypothetical protein
MEKLEESETNRRLSIKGTIVTISVVVSRTFHEDMVIFRYILWRLTVNQAWLVLTRIITGCHYQNNDT